MSARFLSRCSRSVAVFAAVCGLFVNSEVTAVTRVCLDAGHGGTDWGGMGSAMCAEKKMNLNVLEFTTYWLRNNARIQAFPTRTSDIPLTWEERVAVADVAMAYIYVSIHHDDPRPVYIDCSTAGIYEYGPDPWTRDQSFLLGSYLADRVDEQLMSLSTQNQGALTEIQFFQDVQAMDTQDIRQGNVHRPAARISAFGTSCPGSGGACPYDDIIQQEGIGLFYGLQDFSTVPVGNTFQATGGPASVSLTWSESHPNQPHTYRLERSDSCWGPYVFLAYEFSVNGQENYTYIDNTVAYDRPYFYKLIVAGEVVTAAGFPDALPTAYPSGIPGNPSCQVNQDGTASLTWTASSGQVTGYRIIRSQYFPMSSCTALHEIIATTTSTTYTDASAIHGVDLYYRVMAYNGTGSSDASGQTSCSITTDAVGEREAGLRLTPELSVLANATAFRFHLPALDHASVAVYDVQGRLVSSVYSEPAVAGWHDVNWNRHGKSGRVASGLYFARLYTTSGRTATQKFLLLR